MTLRWRPVRAILGKELREFRRNRSLLVGMAIIPAVFCVQPLVTVLALASSASTSLRHEHVLLYMLGIPALVPTLIAAYSIAGERQQGTLEPMLSTPIRREELLLAKALAALIPSIAVAYFVYGAFLACVELFAAPTVADAIIRPIDLLTQVLFTPLLAGWSIWIAILISTRANDLRVAQQLASLAALPTVAVTTLLAFNVLPAAPATALSAVAGLLLLNTLGWRLTSAVFDRERLITAAT